MGLTGGRKGRNMTIGATSTTGLIIGRIISEIMIIL